MLCTGKLSAGQAFLQPCPLTFFNQHTLKRGDASFGDAGGQRVHRERVRLLPLQVKHKISCNKDNAGHSWVEPMLAEGRGEADRCPWQQPLPALGEGGPGGENKTNPRQLLCAVAFPGSLESPGGNAGTRGHRPFSISQPFRFGQGLCNNLHVQRYYVK